MEALGRQLTQLHLSHNRLQKSGVMREGEGDNLSAMRSVQTFSNLTNVSVKREL